jgi:predicted nucleic acid-binding protein
VILVDTSVWIAIWDGTPGYRLGEEDLGRLATCGPVLQEVFQGLRPTAAGGVAGEGLLALPRLSDPVESRLYLAAAGIYQTGRRKGFTIRSSVDCLIAAIAIDNHVPVWHLDRDFTAIAQFTALEIYRR